MSNISSDVSMEPCQANVLNRIDCIALTRSSLSNGDCKVVRHTKVAVPQLSQQSPSTIASFADGRVRTFPFLARTIIRESEYH